MSKILFSPQVKFISFSHRVISFYHIDSMQKVVNDIINIFTIEDMENMSLVVL